MRPLSRRSGSRSPPRGPRSWTRTSTLATIAASSRFSATRARSKTGSSRGSGSRGARSTSSGMRGRIRASGRRRRAARRLSCPGAEARARGGAVGRAAGRRRARAAGSSSTARWRTARPVFYRRGGLDELRRRVEAGELCPRTAPRPSMPGWGASWSVYARRSSPTTSRSSAHSRTRAPSLLPSALHRVGCAVCRRSRCAGGRHVQVSTNVVDTEATAPHTLVEAIVAEAADVGWRSERASSSDCCPRLRRRALRELRVCSSRSAPTGSRRLRLFGAAARALRLEALAADRVLEWHVARHAGP